jgi:hypothetical protein
VQRERSRRAPRTRSPLFRPHPPAVFAVGSGSVAAAPAVWHHSPQTMSQVRPAHNPRLQRTSARGFAAVLAAEAHSFGVRASWFASMNLGTVSVGRGRRPPVHRPDGVGELGKAFESGVATQQRVSALSSVSLDPSAGGRQTPNQRVQRTSTRRFAPGLAADAHSLGGGRNGRRGFTLLRSLGGLYAANVQGGPCSPRSHK